MWSWMLSLKKALRGDIWISFEAFCANLLQSILDFVCIKIRVAAKKTLTISRIYIHKFYTRPSFFRPENSIKKTNKKKLCWDCNWEWNSIRNCRKKFIVLLSTRTVTQKAIEFSCSVCREISTYHFYCKWWPAIVPATCEKLQIKQQD